MSKNITPSNHEKLDIPFVPLPVIWGDKKIMAPMAIASINKIPPIFHIFSQDLVAKITEIKAAMDKITNVI
jgi:hypothetical protein